MRAFSTPIVVCLISQLILGITALDAQESEETWSAILYDHGLNALVDLSPSGVEVTFLPNLDYDPRPFEPLHLWYSHFGHMMVTDDERYLISLVPRGNLDLREPVVTNLITKETMLVGLPPMADEEIFAGYYRVGAFNPEMTEVALPYVSHDTTSGFGCCDSGGIVTIDLAMGAITHTLDIDETFNRPTAWVDDWTNEGIWFAPRCSACTPEYTYTYQLWNPDTDTISATDVFNDRQRSERLATTDELLFSESHPDYPLGGPASRWLLNVVSVYQSGQHPPDVPGQVIYYDDENLDFDMRAHWIMNGRAFLVTNDLHHNVVVFRDGRQLTWDYDNEEYFLGMTSEGWLAIDHATNQVRHYVVSDETIARQTLYHARGGIQVASIKMAPVTEELPPFVMDIDPPDDVFCPAALPTQFEAGDWAEVIVDHQEYPIAALFLGDGEFEDTSWEDMQMLPLGAQVQVLDGLACTSNGWGYLKVAYQGRIGWMLEVWQTLYYLAPIPAPE